MTGVLNMLALHSVLLIPEYMPWQSSEYMSGFWIWQGSEYARITQGSKYATIWVDMSEKNESLRGYVWIYNLQ